MRAHNVKISLKPWPALIAGLSLWRRKLRTLREALAWTGPTFASSDGVQVFVYLHSHTVNVTIEVEGNKIEYVYPTASVGRVRIVS